MIVGLFALAIFVIRAFPKTPAARWLNQVLAERPLEWASKVKRRDIILLFVMAALLLTAGEFVAILGAGELLALAVNLSIYFDAMLITAGATIVAAAASVWRGMRARLGPQGAQALRKSAGRQAGARKTRQPKSSDDESAAAWDAIARLRPA